ncbi:MAG TPA: YlxR family protein [Anaerolineales bacterium]
MSGKPVKPLKHFPLRTCVGCRTVLPKRSLIRLVRLANGDGIQVDPTGKLAGRGAYLHNRRSCWEKGLKGTLAHALKTTLTTDDTQRLRQFMETLPEDEEITGEQA